jgi:hypothetical protein
MAFPFQPMNNQTLKKMTKLNQETNRHKSITECDAEHLSLKDHIALETNRPVSDRNCNHPQTNNS